MPFPVTLNTVNLHWKIKPWLFYKIVKGNFPYVNTPTRADILFENLRPETGGFETETGGIWKTPFG